MESLLPTISLRYCIDGRPDQRGLTEASETNVTYFAARRQSAVETSKNDDQGIAIVAA